jgi:hypothetical protein
MGPRITWCHFKPVTRSVQGEASASPSEPQERQRRWCRPLEAPLGRTWLTHTGLASGPQLGRATNPLPHPTSPAARAALNKGPKTQSFNTSRHLLSRKSRSANPPSSSGDSRTWRWLKPSVMSRRGYVFAGRWLGVTRGNELELVSGIPFGALCQAPKHKPARQAGQVTVSDSAPLALSPRKR